MSLPRYPEYKPSGVEWLGEVPSGWSVKRLRFAALLNPAKSEVAHRPRDSEVSFLPMESIGDDNTLKLNQTRPIGEVETGYTYFRDGDVAVAKITPCFENGKGAVMRGLVNGIGFGTTELTVARPRTGQASAEYLHYLFSSLPFRALGEASMYGSGGQKRLPDDFFRDFFIAFPPLAEQAVIAAFLDRETTRIDALVAEQERLIALLLEKRQAVISHAVTKGLNPDVPMKSSGIEWLGEVPAHWEVKRLKHLARPGTMITYGIVQAGPHFEGGIPYIKTSDMSGESLPLEGYSLTSPDIDESYARSKVVAGDIVIAIRATVGKCLPVPMELDGANLTQGTAKVSPADAVSPEFLLAALRSSSTQGYLDSMAKGATFREITLDALRRSPIPVPPFIEQRQISDFIFSEWRRLDELKAQAERLAEILKERRSVLITAAVTGQIDVRQVA